MTAGASAAARRRRLRDRWRYWVRDPLLFAIDFPLHHAFRLLPIAWASAIGGRLGVLNGRHRFQPQRDRARQGYRRLKDPAMCAEEAEAAIDRLFDSVGRVMAEFSALDRVWKAGRIAVEGAEHLAAAREAGRPVIVMGVHVGNWEVIGPTLAGLGLRFNFIYQPPRSRFEHRIAVAARRRYGAVLLRPGVAAARRALRGLAEERGVLLIFADDERKGYVHAPLFGRAPAQRANLPTIVRLAWASGAAVIPAFAERQPGPHFRVVFLPPVELAPRDPDEGAALLDNVHRLDRAITPPVLALLDQWYMLLDFHRG